MSENPAQQPKGRPTPKRSDARKGDGMQVAADRQRAQVHEAIMAEAGQVLRIGYDYALERMADTHAETIVNEVLVPTFAEATRIRATAARFAPLERAS